MAAYFFSEMPYAVALNAGFLHIHCSHCFGKNVSMLHCTSECKRVVYCSEACMQIDRPFHANECMAYRSGQTRPDNDYNDVQVRMLGRLLARRGIDKGMAVLSTDFPRHLAKDRRLKDLVSHERQFKRTPAYLEVTGPLVDEFVRFFSRTPLASIKRAKAEHFFNVAKVNGFSITRMLSADPRSMADLGEGVYLNASRFNHSCVPSLLFSFAGSRLVVKRVENEGAVGQQSAGGVGNKPLTKKELKRLTFSYGFGSTWNHGTAMSLTSQRRKSLQERYFFRCQCPLCRNKRQSLLQENASTVECSQCHLPYVWKQKPGKSRATLEKMCECRVRDERVEQLVRDWNVQAEAQWLNEDFETVMMEAVTSEDPPSVIPDFEWVLSLAEKYWHPKYNLRYGQLCERILHAWNVKLHQLRTAKQPFDEELESVLKAGESMLRPYLKYSLPWDLTVAVLMHRLAGRYVMKKNDDSRFRRAAELYLMAAQIWYRTGETKCEKFLLGKADSMIKKAQEGGNVTLVIADDSGKKESMPTTAAESE